MRAPTTPGAAPRVLVSAASKHGSTAEIAEHIGEALRRRGCSVDVVDPQGVDAVDAYDAVVLGSAVYAGHWQKEATELAERIRAGSSQPPVWLFSSGPVGDPPKPEEDPVDVADVADATAAREHRIFAGKLDKSRLGFGERAIMIAVRAPEGDYRSWEDISSWAESIADALEVPRSGEAAAQPS